jgi:hypothetical protein
MADDGRRRRGLSGLAVLAALIAGGAAIVTMGTGADANRRERLTARTPATATEVSYDDNGRYAGKTRIVYSYQAEGRAAQGVDSKTGDLRDRFQAGTAGVACYDPRKPSDVEFFAAGHACAAPAEAAP